MILSPPRSGASTRNQLPEIWVSLPQFTDAETGAQGRHPSRAHEGCEMELGFIRWPVLSTAPHSAPCRLLQKGPWWGRARGGKHCAGSTLLSQRGPPVSQSQTPGFGGQAASSLHFACEPETGQKTPPLMVTRKLQGRGVVLGQGPSLGKGGSPHLGTLRSGRRCD